MVIETMSPITGRFLKEDGTYINLADYFSTNVKIKSVFLNTSGQVTDKPCWLVGYAAVTANPSSLTLYNETVDESPTTDQIYPTLEWTEAKIVDENFNRAIYCENGLYADIVGTGVEFYFYIVEDE